MRKGLVIMILILSVSLLTGCSEPQYYYCENTINGNWTMGPIMYIGETKLGFTNGDAYNLENCEKLEKVI